MGFFQIEIILNVSVSPFCFIWIPMLWVYGHYNVFNSFSAVIVFRRQNLTSIDVRAKVSHVLCLSEWELTHTNPPPSPLTHPDPPPIRFPVLCTTGFTLEMMIIDQSLLYNCLIFCYSIIRHTCGFYEVCCTFGAHFVAIMSISTIIFSR